MMKDLEMTKLCAEAMDIPEYEAGNDRSYWPLTEDAQAMALVKKFRLHIHADPLTWWVMEPTMQLDSPDHTDLNRAIVECVAKMQAQRAASVSA